MKIDMTKISKKSKMIAATAFVLGVTAMGAGVANAETGTSANTEATARTEHMTTLVTAIATKFNLNSSDVQAIVEQVMTEERAKMEASHSAAATARLNQAVTDGKLTQAQVALITAKQAETKAFHESLKGKSETDRQAAMKAYMTSLKQWATDNNIPKEFGFGPGHGGPEGKNHGGKGGPGFGPKER